MNLYIIQNETHYKNFLELAVGDDFFIDLSKVTGQNIDFTSLVLKGVNEINLGLDKNNFYLMSSVQRLVYCYKLKKCFEGQLKSYKFEKVIIGNDGALQRLIIDILRRNDKNITVDMWLDGLISLDLFKYKNNLKIFISRFAEFFNLSYFLPSVIGTYKSIKNLYVMDESVKSEYGSLLLKNNETKIIVVQFPRHKKLLDIAHQQKRNKSGVKRVLYLTSAWAFHGHDKWQHFQLEQVQILLNSFNESKNISFQIRVHPRDAKEQYEFVKDSIFSDITHFEEDISSADLVISARSTGLFEAEMIDKDVVIFDAFFQGHFMNSYLHTLPVCNNAEELTTFLSSRGYFL